MTRDLARILANRGRMDGVDHHRRRETETQRGTARHTYKHTCPSMHTQMPAGGGITCVHV